MLAKERHREIIRRINEKGAVTTSELLNFYDVSFETIRRDLMELEKQGALQRVHGGAVRLGEMRSYTHELSKRVEENKRGKEELCETAAMLVNDDDIICIDTGSTAIYFAKALKSRLSRLTVVTSCLDVLNILSDKEGFQIILCGGYFVRDQNFFYGRITLETLKSLHVQKGFIFPSAISLKNGVYDFDYIHQQTQLQMMSISDKVYFLADSHKFEKKALLKIIDMNTEHVYITDSDLNPEYKHLYIENNFNVISTKADIVLKPKKGD